MNSGKIILDLCGGTGSWSKPYVDAGYDVRLATLPDHDITSWYTFEENGDSKLCFKNSDPDVEIVVSIKNIYGILAAPPCTRFSKAAWKIPKSEKDFADGMRCVRSSMDIIWSVQEHGAPLSFWALENPQGFLYNFMGKPAFWFQPWMFGDTSFLATKRTAIWGYFKEPKKTVRMRTIPFVSPHSSKRDVVRADDQNKGWKKASAEDRAKTPEGFARAFYEANK